MENKKLRYIFIPFPTRLDGDWLLNEDEKAFLRRLIGLGSKGWFYGDKCLAKKLGIGVYHLRRARLRLQILGLIRVQKRGTQNFTYYFEDRVEKWRLPEPIAKRLKDDHQSSLNRGELKFEKELFQSKQHFENYFSQVHPKFANGRKGRSKDDDVPDYEESLDDDFLQAPVSDSLFQKRIEKLKLSPDLKVLADYFSYRDQINAAKLGDYKANDPSEALFYEKLEIAADKSMRVEEEKLKLVLQEVHFKLTHGESNLSISNFLEGIYRSQLADMKSKEAKEGS